MLWNQGIYGIKADHRPTNGISQGPSEKVSGVDPAVHSPEGEHRPGSLSGEDPASLWECDLLLSKAHAALEMTPDVRVLYVDSIREQISTGSYQVPFQALARRLMIIIKDL